MLFICNMLAMAKRYDSVLLDSSDLTWLLPLSHIPPEKGDNQERKTIQCRCVQFFYFYLPIIFNYQAIKRGQISSIANCIVLMAEKSTAVDTKNTLLTFIRAYKSKTACHSHGDCWINVWFPWLWPGEGLSCAQCLGICGYFLCTITNNEIQKCKVQWQGLSWVLLP